MRIFISGMGIISSIGIGVDSFWKGLVEGKFGLAPITRFSTKGYRTEQGFEVKDFPPPEARDFRSNTDRFALLAALEAISMANLGKLDNAIKSRWGVVMGTGVAGLPESENLYEKYLRNGSKRGFRILTEHLPSTTSDRIASSFSLGGPSLSIATACSSSTISIGVASHLIKSGDADLMMTGGSDTICRLTHGGFNSLRLVSHDTCRPFDENRSGMVIGEGSAILILESEKHLSERGGVPLCEVIGYGASGDAYHQTAPHPDGAGAKRAVLNALDDAGISPNEIDIINAHGTATSQNDSAEISALRSIFGKELKRIPITSIKGSIGHCLGSSGAMEAGCLALCIMNQYVPPTIGFNDNKEFSDLDITRSAKPFPCDTGISISLAFGGNNGAIILKRVAAAKGTKR